MTKSIHRSSAIFIPTVLTGLCSGLFGCTSYELSDKGTASEVDGRRPIITSLAEPSNDHLVYTAEFRDGVLVRTAVSDALPVQLSSYRPSDIPAEAMIASDTPILRLDPLLAEELASAEGTRTAERLVEVMVTFKETVILPRFPSLRQEPLDSPSNLDVAWRSSALVKLIEDVRAPEHEAHAAELVATYGAKVKETFWLNNGMVIELPLSQVRALEQHPDVQFIEPTHKASPPPAATMLTVRTLENSDSLFTFGGGFVGLLDTGVRRTHFMIKPCTESSLTQQCVWRALDCVNGTANGCQTGSNLNPDDTCDHGTSSAGEIIGRTSNNNNRGMTLSVLNSYKVYDGICAFDSAAGVRGFQASVGRGDHVIIAEIQDRTGGSSGAISTAADNAFNANRIVVAAAGNRGPGTGTVTAPGSARKVLAVGAIDAATQTLIPESGRGPVDSRTKPDLVGLTNITVPSGTSDGAFREFGGTSAATPNVAALAMLVSNFNNRPPAGVIYATMLAIGTQVSGASNNSLGAGLPRWTGNARLVAGSTTVAGSTVDVPINLPSAASSIDVAIWWPEGLSHKNINLHIVNPSGAVGPVSAVVGGVFEKVRVTGSIPTGTWKIRLIPVPATTTSRTVYYAWSPK